MRHRIGRLRVKSMGLLRGTGMIFQFGGCELGTITTTTTVTVDARDALQQIMTAAISAQSTTM